MKEKQILHIKNMVCPRCIMAVKGVFDDVQLPIEEVVLGEVKLQQQASPEQLKVVKERLQELGFDLLESGKSALISKIKTLLIEQIHYASEPLSVNFSTYLSEKLHYEYSYLSRLFSSVEGITIEKFITSQKIEKVKELLFYDEQSLSEIAFQLNYSSVAHLSSQFKKETGMTPTAFKAQRRPAHAPRDSSQKAKS